MILHAKYVIAHFSWTATKQNSLVEYIKSSCGTCDLVFYRNTAWRDTCTPLWYVHTPRYMICTPLWYVHTPWYMICTPLWYVHTPWYMICTPLWYVHTQGLWYVQPYDMCKYIPVVCTPVVCTCTNTDYAVMVIMICMYISYIIYLSTMVCTVHIIVVCTILPICSGL